MSSAPSTEPIPTTSLVLSPEPISSISFGPYTNPIPSMSLAPTTEPIPSKSSAPTKNPIPTKKIVQFADKNDIQIISNQSDTLDINKSQSVNSGMFSKLKSLFSSTEQTKSECNNVISTELYNLIEKFRNKLKEISDKGSLDFDYRLKFVYSNNEINQKSTYKDVEKIFKNLYIDDKGLINFFYQLQSDNDIIELIKLIYEYAFKKCNSHNFKTLTDIQNKFIENKNKLLNKEKSVNQTLNPNSNPFNQTLNPSKPAPNSFKQTPTPSIQQSAPKLPINTNTNPKDSCDINNYKPRGLQNCGNTCYMNSVIQALLGIKKFREKVFNLINSNSNKDISYYTDNINYKNFRNLNLEKSKETFQIKLLNFLNDIICKKPIIEFKKIVEFIIEKVKFPKGIQNDADEFIYYLINGLGDYISLLPKDIIDLFKYNSSFKIFNNEIDIIELSKSENQYEFKLSIEGDRKIMDLINDNMKEDIQEYNYNNNKINVIKKTYFESYPDILFVSIPLFTNDKNKYIRNTRTNITFDNYSNITIKSEKYKLVSFICHKGESVNSGHYWAYVKVKEIWYRCDDNSIYEPINTYEIKDNFNKLCTVCFYEKE